MDCQKFAFKFGATGEKEEGKRAQKSVLVSIRLFGEG